MARNRPRKGTEMMRGAGYIPAPLIAGLTMFPVTFGSVMGPDVTVDVFEPFALQVLSDPTPMMPPARRTQEPLNGASGTRRAVFDPSPLVAGLYMSRIATAPVVVPLIAAEDCR